jgi:hypothetical protein
MHFDKSKHLHHFYPVKEFVAIYYAGRFPSMKSDHTVESHFSG